MRDWMNTTFAAWPEICVLALICVALGFGFFLMGLCVPRRLVKYRIFPYAPYSFERDGEIYKKIGIQKWKTKIPDMSRYVRAMFKKRITTDRSAAYIERLAVETCVAEITHWALMLASPVFAYLYPGPSGIMYMFLYALGNLPFALVQRYNRPRMLRVLDAQRAREAKENRASDN